MNSEHSENLDDVLGEQLRDIEIPTGLKDRLRAITDESPGLVTEKRRPRGRRRTLILIAVAASLIGAFSIVGWRLQVTPRQTNHDATAPVETNGPEGNSVLAQNLELTGSQLIEMIGDRQAVIDRILQQLELTQLRTELASLKRVRHPARLNPVDELSMILVLTDQARIGFGGDVESIQKDLQMVIKRYPDSRGAILASTLVSNTEL